MKRKIANQPPPPIVTAMSELMEMVTHLETEISSHSDILAQQQIDFASEVDKLRSKIEEQGKKRIKEYEEIREEMKKVYRCHLLTVPYKLTSLS